VIQQDLSTLKSSMNNFFLKFAAITGLLSVISGAFLAHQLKQKMPASAVDVFETAVRYQFYHSFALLAVGLLSEKFKTQWIARAGNCFIAGIILFCGSLYTIALLISNGKEIPVVLGICTPLGGLGFILGWIFLTIAVWTRRGS
jgi:uncharacterized membrane protein YgdD (TMEM256/DUF423 family)